MPNYKLVYFDARGRAEAIRLMFAHVGQKFEDVRHSHEEWPKIKEKYPMQQLPYMEVDGKPLTQSRAIQGYVAREFGLNGATNAETTKIEIVIATLEDLLQPLVIMHSQGKDVTKEKKLMETFYAEQAPKQLKALEYILKNNNSGDGFFIGSKISRADIAFFATAEALDNDEVLKKFPKIFALKNRVAKDQNIAEYLAQRPKTKF